MSRPRRHTRAFTLLEVTMATAIFATAIVVLSQAFTNALRSMENRRKEADLSPMLDFLRQRILTVPGLAQFEQGEELYLPENDRANWTATVEPTQVADLFKVNLRIEIVSSQEERATVREETLYLLRPTWSDSDDRDDLIEDAERELETRKRSLAQ